MCDHDTRHHELTRTAHVNWTNWYQVGLAVFRYHGLVLTFNPQVVGSSPTGGTSVRSPREHSRNSQSIDSFTGAVAEADGRTLGNARVASNERQTGVEAPEGTDGSRDSRHSYEFEPGYGAVSWNRYPRFMEAMQWRGI